MKKKLLSILLAIVVLSSFCIPAFAASAAEVVGKYNSEDKTVTITGTLPDDYMMLRIRDKVSGEFVVMKGSGNGGELNLTVSSGLLDTDSNTRYLIQFNNMEGELIGEGYVEFERSHTHSWATEWTTTDTHHWHECTAADCTVTENSGKDSYGEHEWDEGTVTKQPTATETGIRTRTCKICGETKTEEIPITQLTEISSVAVTLKTDNLTTASSLPQAATTTEGVKLTTVWKDSNGNVVTKFTSTGTYTAEITVAADTGYKLADNVTYTLNGETVSLSEGVLKATASVKTSGGGGGGGGGGGSSSSSASNVSVKSSSNGTVKFSPSRPTKGDTVTLTVTPKSGYKLSSIKVLDSKGNEIELTKTADGKYTFVMPAGKVSVDAQYVKDDGSDTETPATSFTDVPDTHWANAEITWAAENGIMNGIGNNQFAPDRTVTRQQLWMVMARMAGANPENMAGAREWAMSTNISDGTNPGNPLTRQQLVAILYRYAQLKGYSTDGATDITTFPDHNTVSNYAKDPMAWAVGNGIIAGKSDGRLDPTGTATRAQFAVIMYRFDQKFAN